MKTRKEIERFIRIMEDDSQPGEFAFSYAVPSVDVLKGGDYANLASSNEVVRFIDELREWADSFEAQLSLQCWDQFHETTDHRGKRQITKKTDQEILEEIKP